MGTRIDALEKQVEQSNCIRDMLESSGWKEYTEPYLQQQIDKAREAWWKSAIDGKTNEQLVRNMVAQRATVLSLTNFVNHLLEIIDEGKRAVDELAIIENKKK